MHHHTQPPRKNADLIQRLPASPGMHHQVGRPLCVGHMGPVQLPRHPHPGLIAMHRLLGLHQIPFHGFVHRLHSLGQLFPGGQNRRPSRRNILKTLLRKMMILVQVHRHRLQPRPVLRGLGHSRRERGLADPSTHWARLDFRLMLRDLYAHFR